MTLFYVSPDLDNVDKQEEMNLWKQLSIMMSKPVQYNSFLWSVERPSSPPTYLFGTIHAPNDLVWRYIPINAKDALWASSHVYTEVNLKDSSVREAIQKCRHLPGNLTLKEVLPSKLYHKLRHIMKRFEKRRKVWVSKLNQPLFANYLVQDIYEKSYKLKPSWLLYTILQEWNKFYVKSEFRSRKSLDGYLVESSSEYGTYRGGIEDVSMHCDPMDNLSKERVNLALNVSLFAQEMKMSGKWRIKENDIRRVVNLYKCGDPLNTSRLVTLFGGIVNKTLQKQLAEIDDYLYRELIYKRNVAMSKRIDSMFRDKSYDTARMYFAVGAAHLLGNNSVVSMLRAKGYNVRHIGPNEDIPSTIKRKKLEESRKWNTPNDPIWHPFGQSAEEMDSHVKKDPYVYYSSRSDQLLSRGLNYATTFISAILIRLLCT